MITSTIANKYAVVKSFASSSIVGCSYSLEMKVLKKKFQTRRAIKHTLCR